SPRRRLDRPFDLDPALLARASQDGLADKHLVVAVGKRGVTLAGFAFSHRRVDVGVERTEGLGEAFGVAAGKARSAPSLLVEDRRIAQQKLVVAAAMPQPELIRALRVP